VKSFQITILPRLCINCGAGEHDHVNGQCLFATTQFTPHRLSGPPREPVARELWAPVVLDVQIADERTYFRGPKHMVGSYYVGADGRGYVVEGFLANEET
jgi:hypothetical protein